MIDREHKIVKLSILVLCFALIFVYMVRFYVKGSQLKIINSNTNSDTPQRQTNEMLSSGNNTRISEWSHTPNITHTIEEQNKETQGNSWDVKNIKIENEEIVENNNEEIKTPTIVIEDNNNFVPPTVEEKQILSGTHLVDEEIELVKSLGIQYKYALRDMKGIEYLYLWNWLNNDFVEIAHKQKWTIFSLNTEYEIKKNELFGERVLYLNLPDYSKKKVLMIVKYDDKYWLLNIDYPIYHSSKKYLKDLFTD